MRALLLACLLAPAITLAEDPVVQVEGQTIRVDGRSQGVWGVPPALVKKIIAFKKGDVVLYDGWKAHLEFIIPFQAAVANDLPVHLPFVLMGEAAYYPAQQGTAHEVLEQGRWVLTRFPGSDVSYIDTLRATPFATRFPSAEPYQQDLQDKLQALSGSDRERIAAVLSDLGARHRPIDLVYFNLVPKVIDLLERDPATLGETARARALEYLAEIHQRVEGRPGGHGQPVEWRAWWDGVVHGPGFKALDLSRFTVSDLRVEDPYGETLQRVGRLAFEKVNGVRVIDLDGKRLRDVGMVPACARGLGTMAASATEVAVLERNKPSEPLRLGTSSLEPGATSQCADLPETEGTENDDRFALKALAPGRWMVFFSRKKELHYGIVGADGKWIGGLRTFMPVVRRREWVTDQGKRVQRDSAYRPKTWIEARFESADVLPDGERTLVAVSVHTRLDWQNGGASSVHLLVLDRSGAIVSESQIDQPDPQSQGDLELRLVRGRGGYLVAWLNEFVADKKEHVHRRLAYRLLDARLQFASEQIYDAGVRELLGPLYHDGQFYMPYVLEDALESYIAYLRIDAATAARQSVPVYKAQQGAGSLVLDVDRSGRGLELFFKDPPKRTGLWMIQVPLTQPRTPPRTGAPRAPEIRPASTASRT